MFTAWFDPALGGKIVAPASMNVSIKPSRKALR